MSAAAPGPVEPVEPRPAPPHGTRTLRVVQGAGTPDRAVNPFCRLMVEGLPPGVTSSWFSWRTGITGRYDVLHLHWPEAMMRADSRVMLLAKQVAMSALVLRLTLTRRTVVRTLHNLSPHEPSSRFTGMLLRRLDRMTRHWILLNDAVPVDRAPQTVVPHGHYLDVLERVDVPVEPGRLLFFGLVRRYKGVDRLVDAYRGVAADDSGSLVVAGGVVEEDLRAALDAAAAADDRIHVVPRYVSEAELSHELARCELVVLPYDDFYNSGALLMAMSARRPVMVPRTATTVRFQQEFGERWVLLYDGPLTTQHLTDAVRRVRAERHDRGATPPLAARDWRTLGHRVADVYLTALGQRPHAPADVRRA